MVYVFLATGFEESEAFVPVDLLRRAGIEVKTVGITGRQVTSAHAVTVLADLVPEEAPAERADMVFLPGGIPGAPNLLASDYVRKAVAYCVENGRHVAAICAAPSTVLGGMGLLSGRCATCFPGMEDGMAGATPQNVPCCVDGNFITGRSAGAVFEFALTLVRTLAGDEAAEAVRSAIHYAE